MANLTFSLPELIYLLKLNTELPNKIEEINVVNNQIKLTINPAKFLPNFNVFVSFFSFERGMLKLKLKTGTVLNLISKLLSSFIQKYKITGLISFQKDNMLQVELNKILKQKVNGVQVKSITEDNGEFKIVV